MKALYYLGEKTLELRDVPVPAPREGEYLIKIEACGICGSDYEGYLGKTGRRTPPMVMGHESAGVVERAPAGALYPAGTRVAIFPNFYCGTCEFCRQGRTNICDNAVFLGILQYDGCMAEYVTAKEEFLVPFGESLSFEEAAMAEPLAVALDAVTKISDEELAKSEYTIVVGGGTIGLLVVLLLKYRGVKNLLVSDTFDFRLDLAKKLGADGVINPVTEDFAEAVKRLTDGKMCPLAFEAVGFSATAASSIEALRTAGKAVWIGNAVKMVQINMQKIVTTENTIVGTHIYTLDEFKKCLRLLEDGAVDVKPIITGRYPLTDGAEAFRTLENNEGGKNLKLMLRM